MNFNELQIIFINYKVNKTLIGLTEKYSKKYNNIISLIADKPDASIGELYNIGMKHAASEYIMFLNSNSILKKEGCELLYNEISAEKESIISGALTNDNVNINLHHWKNILNNEDYRKIKNNETINLKINSIEEYPTLSKDQVLENKIIRKDIITKNNIKFLENNIEFKQQFILKTLLSAKGIKYIDKLILQQPKQTIKFSDKLMKEHLDSYYEMFYYSNSKNKTKIFVKNILFEKLEQFVKKSLLKCNIPITQMIEILNYAKPLFKLCLKYHNVIDSNFALLYEYISKGNFENALQFIYHLNIPKQHEIKILTLCDQYTYQSFKYECDLIQINSKNYINQFELEEPDLFLATSLAYNTYTNQDINKLKKILDYCNENGIISIFWDNNNITNVNFEETSLEFDYIFTNCEKNIAQYREKYENVFYLPYAAQPKLFNPISKNERQENTVNYFGSWEGNNLNKCELITKYFKKILSEKYNLEIYDLNNVKKESQDSFPSIYDDYINTIKKYSEIPKLYKTSEIGFAFQENRDIINHEIFELILSNTVIFSNFSKPLYDLFKDNIYYLDYENFEKINEKSFEKIKNENIEEVFEKHTYETRFKQILDAIKFEYIPKIKHILLFYKLDNLNNIDKIYNHFYSIDYPFKELRIITTKDKLFLPNTILESELKDIKLADNYYFCFADFNLDPYSVKNSLHHFSYIEKKVGIKESIGKKFVFDKTKDTQNVIFNSYHYQNVISKNNYEFNVYYFNNFRTKVSVIIPVFNVEKYLKECLDSVCSQTLKDIEIICVNDGSTDSSEQILKEYSKKDPRIRIFSQENKGPGGARNTGLDNSQGEYIYFIDSDDYIEPNGLSEMYIQAKTKNLDMLKFNLMTFDEETGENKKLYQRIKPAFLKELGDRIFDYKTIKSDVYTLSPNMQSTFFRTELVKNIRFPENIIFEDNIFLIESLLNSKRVYYYDKFLSTKRERKNSITNSSGEQFLDIIEIRNDIVDLAKKYDFYEEYKFTIYSRKYMFIKLLFLKTEDPYKQRFFEKIKQDCIDKKEEYETEKIFNILDNKSITIFNSALKAKDYMEFEELILNA